MSNDRGLSVWVRDLDGYISIDAINAESKRIAQESALELELDEIGDLPLLAGRTTSARQLHLKEITPSNWRHAVHLAEMAIGAEPDGILSHRMPGRETIESRFLRAMLNIGRSYAVARYARWERLDYPSAITATLPHGIRALVNQFLAAEGIVRSASTAEAMRSALTAGAIRGMTAYRRTRTLQASLHAIADESPDHPGGPAFDRYRTNVILSLARLHFCIVELEHPSTEGLRCLAAAYAADREALGRAEDRLTPNGRTIRAWRLRHIRPLLDFYPYAIRHSLARAAVATEFSRAAIVNELALAHCGIQRMRRAGQNRTRTR